MGDSHETSNGEQDAANSFDIDRRTVLKSTLAGGALLSGIGVTAASQSGGASGGASRRMGPPSTAGRSIWGTGRSARSPLRRRPVSRNTTASSSTARRWRGCQTRSSWPRPTIERPQLPPYDTGNGEYTGGVAPDLDGKVTETNFDYNQLPEGYARAPDPVADQRYITDMGEHTAPGDAPELPDGPTDTGDPSAFSNTLIQGFVGDKSGSRLAFVEPMLTREFLQDVRGTMQYEVPQPSAYPHDLQHPSAYSVRDVPSQDRIAVVLQDFESV